MRYSGVGNIAAVLIDCRTGATTSMVSQNGTVGYAIRKVKTFVYPWTLDSLLLMHSDGLATHWNLERYPGLAQMQAGVLAGILYRDFKRGRDDVTVLAAARCEDRAAMNLPLLSLEIRIEVDIVLARQQARQIARLLGFAPLDQTRIATATSEIARNTVSHAGGARIEFCVESGAAPHMVMRIRERGAGTLDFRSVLDGIYESPTGLGLGIIGARRLMDRFEIESSSDGGSSVVMAKATCRLEAKR